ncbi:hypothetical protein KAX02_03035 [candidate division WOR-3 bacterium]|nr:hypothetical protein [candidate division WOR-3 bacterium]
MANFLADIGRSNMLESVTGTISAINSMRRTNAAVALGERQRQSLDLEIQKTQYEVAEREKRDKWLNEEVPLQANPMFLKLSKPNQEKITRFFIDQKVLNPETGLGSRRSFLRGIEFMETTREGMENFLKPILDEQKGEITELQTQLKEAELKGDTKTIEKLQPVFAAKVKQYSMGATVYGKRLDQLRELEKIEAKKTAKAPSQWETYYTAQKAKGLSDTKIVEGFKKLGKAPKKSKTPTLVNWTTATKQVSNRFGKQDALGNIIITPELQGMNRIAQKRLVELKKAGKINPLDAVNISEDFARNIENRYWEYLDAAKKDKSRLAKIRKDYKAQYGYIPKRRMR